MARRVSSSKTNGVGLTGITFAITGIPRFGVDQESLLRSPAHGVVRCSFGGGERASADSPKLSGPNLPFQIRPQSPAHVNALVIHSDRKRTRVTSIHRQLEANRDRKEGIYCFLPMLAC